MCTVCMPTVPTMKPSGALFRLTQMCPPPLVSHKPSGIEDLLNAWQLTPRICVEREDATWKFFKLTWSKYCNLHAASAMHGPSCELKTAGYS